jgi:DnaJ-class molecular chaperone
MPLDRRDGHNVDCRVEITRAEALAGTRRTLLFHAPDGQPRPIVVVIQAGAQLGLRIRIAGEGGPGLNGGRRGDLYAVVAVVEQPGYRAQDGVPPPAQSLWGWGSRRSSRASFDERPPDQWAMHNEN